MVMMMTMMMMIIIIVIILIIIIIIIFLFFQQTITSRITQKHHKIIHTSHTSQCAIEFRFILPRHPSATEMDWLAVFEPAGDSDADAEEPDLPDGDDKDLTRHYSLARAREQQLRTRVEQVEQSAKRFSKNLTEYVSANNSLRCPGARNIRLTGPDLKNTLKKPLASKAISITVGTASQAKKFDGNQYQRQRLPIKLQLSMFISTIVGSR